MSTKAIVATALLVALAGTAQAVTLVTPPLYTVSDGELDCTIVNVGRTPVRVSITSVFREEEPLTEGPLVLEPGEIASLRNVNN